MNQVHWGLVNIEDGVDGSSGVEILKMDSDSLYSIRGAVMWGVMISGKDDVIKTAHSSAAYSLAFLYIVIPSY